jgi:hypothetical protein
VTRFFPKRASRAARDAERGWPDYMFGGHVRTSTLVLVIAFLALWWVYDDHAQSVKSNTKPTQVPATQIVPPGFVPDPNYTWVPRTKVQEPRTTETPTPTPTTTTPPPTTTTTPPPFGLPPIVLPPPFGPPTTTPSPPPGQSPTPTPAPTPAPGPALPPLPQIPGLP